MRGDIIGTIVLAGEIVRYLGIYLYLLASKAIISDLLSELLGLSDKEIVETG